MEKKNVFAIMLCSMSMAMATSCGNEDTNFLSEVKEQQTPNRLTEAQSAEIGRGINAFSLRALSTMASKEKGTSKVFAPVGAASVLAMLNDGAAGSTRQELMSLLGCKEATTEALNEFFKGLTTTSLPTTETTRLTLANAVFVSQGQELNPVFASAMESCYEADIDKLDFHSPVAVDHINSWCSQKTQGMIPRFLETVKPNWSAVLLNAFYFNGKWKTPFICEFTTETAFLREDGTQTVVPMMAMDTHNASKNEYYETASYQALRMDYGEGSYAMTFILPKQGSATCSDVLNALTADEWQELCSKLNVPEGMLAINLPRFSVENGVEDNGSLAGTLQDMGATSILGDNACYPNVLVHSGLRLLDICQKAVVSVTEEGTEAASSTGAWAASDPGQAPKPIFFRADHPFLFVISNKATGLIYLIGTYQG